MNEKLEKQLADLDLGTRTIGTELKFKVMSFYFLSYAEEKYGISDIKDITNLHIAQYLQTKIDEKVSKNYLKLVSSALAKLKQAIDNRAYLTSEEIVSHMGGKYKEAKLQLDTGLRISELKGKEGQKILLFFFIKVVI